MKGLLAVSRAIDRANEHIGRLVAWAIVAAVLVSAINAIIRKVFEMSSNAWLELQWYLFGAVFMLCAAWTLRANEHIRIDIVSSRLSYRARNIVEMIGHLFFLLPFVVVMVYLSTPFFLRSAQSGEVSTNVGGLLIWPAKGLILLGFILLGLQWFSETVKRIAVMRGELRDDHLSASHHAAAEAEAERLLAALEGDPRADIPSDAAAHEASIAPYPVPEPTMAELIAANLAPIMFAALVIFLLLGYPVAFSLAANGLLFFVIAVELAPYAPHAIRLDWPLLQALPERIYQTMGNEVLLAVPFFTFMGLVLERSGMAEDLLDTIGQLFGTVRGGLAYAVVFVGALLAATTGVVAASVISMGLISLPIMLRYGYDRRLASGVIAASGTLAQIIPPSLVLIVMADQLGRSVGDMYEGAFIPGIVLAGLYALYVFMATLVKPHWAPGLPVDAIGYREPTGARGVWQLGVLVLFSAVIGYLVLSQTTIRAGADFVILTICVAVVVALVCALVNRFLGAQRLVLSAVFCALTVALYYYLLREGRGSSALFVEMLAAAAVYAFVVGVVERFTGLRLLSRMAEQVTFVMVPPLLLIFLVLGTIFIGVATPTEGGAMGALGSLILAAAKRFLDNNPRRFNFDLVRQATESTAKLSAFVLFILIGARVFSLTFYGVNGHVWVEHLLTSLPGGQVGFLVVTNVMIFLLAFFLDFFELAFIVIPLLGPAAEKLGIDLIWFGVVLGVNMQTSFMHPPFGFALFFLRSVAPKDSYLDRITGNRMEPVTTGQIYWGAVPFVIIQCIMVGLVILFPQMVMHYKSTGTTIDPAAVEKKLENLQLPGLDTPGGGIPGLPQLDMSQPPKIQ